MLLLASLAWATHVTTFALDPLYTKPPFSGLESVVVDPVAFAAAATPWKGATDAWAQRLPNEARPRERALQFTNPTNTWGWLLINDQKVGTIGPYATARLEGLALGEYKVSLILNNGYRREFLIRVGPRPNVPSGAPVAVTVGRERIELSDKVYFEYDSAAIDAVSHALLDAVAAALAAHPEVTLVAIQGHTDTQGDADYNQKLSEQRAAAVRDYLVGKGVDAARLTSAGFGESRPLVAGDDDDAHDQNRRVEFLVQGYTEPQPVIQAPKRGSKK